MSIVVDSQDKDDLAEPLSEDKKNGLFLLFDEHDMPRVPWKGIFTIVTGAIVFLTAYRLYLLEYAFTYGTDYFDPVFDVYWMRLFYIQMIGIPLIAVVMLPYLWFTRPKDPHAAMPPKRELGIYYMIFGSLLIGSILFIVGFGLIVEGDAAWHQTTIRDTDFTPTHIQLFYLMIPIIITGIPILMMWLHTRMPDFIGRLSVPLCIVLAGFILIMPNVGFNEWGHTFFYAEELFGAPIHWGFVILGWGFFGIMGFMLQCLRRILVLTSLESNSPRENPTA